MKRFWICCLFGLFLFGCTHGAEAPKEGRIGIGVQAEKPVKAEGQLKLDKAVAVQNWSGVYANHANNRPHAQLSAKAKLAQSVSIGDGVSGSSVTLAGPIVARQTAYTLDSDFALQATDLKNGKKLWRRKLADVTGTTAKSISLTRNQKVLYAVAGNGLIIALDFNGKELWRTQVNAFLRSAAVVDNGQIFVSSLSNELFVLDAQTGEKLWTYTGENGVTNFFGMGTPALSRSLVIMTTTSGRVNAFDRNTGVLVWTEDMWSKRTYNPMMDMTHITASPVIEGDVVYLVGNAGKSGAYRLSDGLPLFTVALGGRETPVVSGDALFMLTNQNTLVALNKKKGTQYWETTPVSSEKDKATWYGPVVAGESIVVVSSNGDIVFYNAKTGQETRREMQKPFVSAPVFASDAMLLLTRKGKLLIYR